jgi:DNA-binding NarL/FixJ family response regulator
VLAQQDEQCRNAEGVAARVLIIGQPGSHVDRVKQVLESADELFEVSCITPVEPCSRYFVEGHPDILLIQDNARPGQFEDFLAEMVTGYDAMRVIVFGQSMSDDYLFRIVDAGVHGYINEHMNGEHILGAVKAVMAGKYWVERHVMEMFIASRSIRDHMRTRITALGERLTNRETEVLSLVMEGLSTSEIADKIFLSHQGVKAHLTTLFRKFNVRNRPQLILSALDEVSPVNRMTKLVQQELQTSNRKTGPGRNTKLLEVSRKLQADVTVLSKAGK